MSALAVNLARLVKFEHSIFALPFAFIGAVVAASGLPDIRTVLLIILAMVSARTAAMTFNRIADQEFDSQNPRTARRELVTGVVSPVQAWILLAASCALFITAAYFINQLAFTLSFAALVIILGYSYTKRFTSMSHLALGLALSIAPVGAWIAVTGRIDLAPVILAAAVMLWTAGFDIIYSLQDSTFDRDAGLYSLPARLGDARALLVSRILHIGMAALLLWFGLEAGLGLFYWIGVGVVVICLVWEQSLVSPTDKSRINAAFFTANGFVSIALFLFTLVDVLFEI